MLQRSRGWAYAFIDDEPVVIRERDLDDGGTLVTPELNPAIKADFYDALDEEVAELLEDAAQRAEDNDWKTAQARDL